MAFIKCPECGKEVSDTAERCSGCGCDIKRNIDEMKKQERRINKSKKSSMNKSLILVVIFIVVIIGVFVGIQKQRDKDALTNLNLLFSHIEDISEYKMYVFTEVDGKYYYNDDGADFAIDEISQRISNLDICVKYIDEHYSKSKNAIDDKIEETNYGCKTWEEYREYLNSNYFLDEDISNQERAVKILIEYVELMEREN